ncbi:hypothetical protein HK405_002039, partial [Cladochytrium tenue]
MSSFPGRLHRAKETLRSLATQSLPPDRIYVHAPLRISRLNISADADNLPPVFAEFKALYPDLLEFTHPQDYGPSTKLLGTLLIEKDPDTIVIT